MRMNLFALLAVAVCVAVAPFVRADDERAPDLASRCEAVTWDEPPGDHLPQGLRAIEKELTSKGPSVMPDIEDALPRSVNLRRTAPDVLQHWPCDRTRKLLLAQLADPDEKAAHHAAWALGIVGGAEVVQPLIDAASRPGSMVREQVLSALERLGATDRAYDVIEAGLSDKGWWIRLGAARALVNLNREDKLDAAIALAAKVATTDSDARVKEAAARSERVLRAKK